MSVTLHSRGAQRGIAVLGRVDGAGAQELAQALDEAGTAGLVEVSFYDADTLPRDAVELLAGRLAAGQALRIVAYHALLAHSLMRLGLPVRQVANRPAQAAPAPCRALALAGSAQSLDKILHIVAALPLSDVAVFVLQHVEETQVNLLDQLLKVRTCYEVVMPQHMAPVRAGTLYVAPPGFHMKVAHGLVYLTCDRKVQFSRPSIDALLDSLAGEYGAGTLAVLLCGYGCDGVAGCAAVRAAGGTVIVEEGSECEGARAMPDAARDAGHYDYVMNLRAIASVAAASVAGDAAAQGPLLELFLDAVAHQCGYDFRNYQRDSLQRRFAVLLRQFGFDGFGAFQRAVLSDAALFERLVSELPVGVTSFFRHPEQLRLLREEILPYLASFPMIKLWSAGCSTGEEAYSLAIMLEELGLLERSHLFATDISAYLLDLAKSGLFPQAGLEQNRRNYLAAGGGAAADAYLVQGPGFLRVPEHLRLRVLFHRHSLTGEGVFNEFQLILCRNVLIYFDAELQRKVLQRFARSLHVDGFLVLGPQDGLNMMALELGFVPFEAGSYIYRRGGALHD
ncbi:chemotaxis protein methyltransferase CheR [Duganella sp. CF458]|uniref:CheR family methyltransferase n=1 Tax=Duganella sp. CF458 TaxID=1884368 RepID=UPI0008F22A8D|nr:CheR family methyltransferase [Duganella sp. CF458]SFF67562.1 chemotaxis protein methyltransferase CheR [Duganella sp. CF458]